MGLALRHTLDAASLVARRRAFDSFTRADSTTAIGTAESGQTWANTSGTWGISSNQAYCTNETANSYRATLDAGTSNCVVEATVTPVTGVSTGLIARLSDAANNIYTFVAPGGNVTIAKFTGGVFSSLATGAPSPAISNGVPFRMRLTVRGSVIAVSINGRQIVTVTETDHISNTRVGLFRNTADATARFDDFRVLRV